jgi:DNA polymerase-2
MDSIPGLYTNVLVLDFKSLYPSIIRTFKIDPMGMIKALEHEQPEELTADSHYIEGYMGGRFSKTEHFLPAMIADLWAARDEAKRVKDPALSQEIKIIMNSFYGVLGSNGCRFHDTRLASSITLRGHEIIQTTSELIEEQGYKVIYGDTDSVFVWIEEEVSAAQADNIGQALIEKLNVWWKDECLNTHGIDCFLELEYETHYQQFVMPTIRGSDQGSKKRYAGLVSQDGEDKMVFKGLETVRTDWTLLAREFQKELYRRIFYNEPFEQYIKDTVAGVKNSTLDHKLVYRKRLRRKLEDYQRNVPPHVRAAQKADAWLVSQNKSQRYQRGGWIEYVMTVKGPEPLEHHPSTLDYDFYIERQLEPVADGILHFLGKSFEEITNQQLGLF